MVTVVIQPSFGNAAARAHWRDTLDDEVDFRVPQRAVLLSPDERAGLDEAHPAGRARFWGATSSHDRVFDSLGTGDVVLFTGGKQVRGIGEMGVVLRNVGFADSLWRPDPVKGSWRNVYSLLSFQPTDIPYGELQQLLGTSANDNFMGLRVVGADLTDIVLDGLGIHTTTADRVALSDLTSQLRTLANQLGQDQLIPTEANRVTATTWLQQARTVTARRTESALLELWKQTLPGEAEVRRIRCQNMLTDAYVSHNGIHDLVEAKAASDHAHVREALGQLLDYAEASTSPCSRLTALFPQRPTPRDIGLLHRYGIDCLYGDGNGSFHREECSTHQRHTWAQSTTASL